MTAGLRYDVGGITVELVTGDIANQPGIDAVVNAANAQLQPGGGVAGAIHRAAGPGLAEECRPYAPIGPAECVLTGGHELPNPHVIHCLGPVYGTDEPADRLLADCYRNALSVADRHSLTSVAFPAISTGAFGYPLRDAADVAVRALLEAIPELRSVTRIRLVQFDDAAFDAFSAALKRHAPSSP